MKNVLLRAFAALALTAGLMACSSEPEDGVLGGSSTPSVDGVWLVVKAEYDVDALDEDGDVIDYESFHDTEIMDTADVFARSFMVIRDGAAFRVGYAGEYDELDAASATRLKPLGGGRYLRGMKDTISLKRDGKNLLMEQIFDDEADGLVGTIRVEMRAYSRSFPPDEWYVDPTEAYEPDDTRATAKSITSDGESQTRYLAEDDQDWFSFQAKKGTAYDIEIDPEYDIDVTLRLYDKDGKLLDADERYIEWECPANGTYYFRASNSGYYEGYYDAYVYSYDPNGFSLAKTKARKAKRPNAWGDVPLQTYPR